MTVYNEWRDSLFSEVWKPKTFQNSPSCPSSSPKCQSSSWSFSRAVVFLDYSVSRFLHNIKSRSEPFEAPYMAALEWSSPRQRFLPPPYTHPHTSEQRHEIKHVVEPSPYLWNNAVLQNAHSSLDFFHITNRNYSRKLLVDTNTEVSETFNSKNFIFP